MSFSEIKKVAIVRSSYNPFGGTENICLNILKKLLELQFYVTLLTNDPDSWPISHKNLEIVFLGARRGGRFWKTFFFNREVEAYLSGNDFKRIFSFDRISSFTHMHAGGTHMGFLKRDRSTTDSLRFFSRKISPFHNYCLFLEKKGFFNPRLKRIQCCSNMISGEIKDLYGVDQKKLKVVYNGIGWEEIGWHFERRRLVAAELFGKHGIDEKNNYLLFLGSGFYRKGLDIAIEGIGFLPKSYHLLVIGKGSVAPYLKMARNMNVLDRIHFLGPQAAGWRYAAVSKALLLPSRYEPFGIACAEVQAMGLPVLVSDCTGFGELVVHRESGVLFAQSDGKDGIEAAFRELRRLIHAPPMSPSEIRSRMRRLDNANFHEKVIQDFAGSDAD
ncbi:MAG: glycosyltransferase family 4 protein [Desulfococcaceae bacterium]